MKIKLQKDRTYWVTSDLHLGHKNILKYEDRPFKNVEEMDETLINNWNETVQPNDIVFNLGDFAFFNGQKIIETLEQLNGEQLFIFGNHDKNMTRSNVKNYVKETGKIRFFDTLETYYKGYSLFMSHYAHRVWNKHHHGAMHLYGHSHGSLPGLGRSVDVGVDSQELFNNYTPLHIDTVINYLEKKEIHFIDLHEE